MSLIVALLIGTDHQLVDEIAYHLGKKGVCVLFCSNDENKLEGVIKTFSDEEIQPKLIVFDAIDVRTIENVVGQIDTQFGKLDILINTGTIIENGLFQMNALFRRGVETEESIAALTVSQICIPLLKKSPSVVSLMCMAKSTTVIPHRNR